ncbi:MAG: hypothetical protein QM679_09695 [Patulibacter sp.]
MSSPADAHPQPTGGRRILPWALGGFALLIVVAVVGLLSRENESNPVDDVSAALQSHAELLAGPLSVTALEHTRCVSRGSGEFACTPVMDNSDAKAIIVRYSGGVLTKRLAGSDLAQAPTTGVAIAAALDADERATLGRTVRYGCAFTVGLNPDGTQSGGAGGFRCATAKPLPGEQAVLQRYVEFADDGSVTRDFMLPGA